MRAMAKKKPQPVPPSIPEPSLRLEWLDPAELAENPANWRRHPGQQLVALTDVIVEVGWAGACLFNERTGRLIDGHARRKVALDQGATKVPVLVGNWTDEQEKKILVTLDPLAAMAEADAGQLDTLLREVSTGSEAIQQMLTELAEKSGVIPDVQSAQDEWPAMAKTENHEILLHYTSDDVEGIETFIGGKIDPIHTGKKIIERIKATAADRADQ